MGSIQRSGKKTRRNIASGSVSGKAAGGWSLRLRAGALQKSPPGSFNRLFLSKPSFAAWPMAGSTTARELQTTFDLAGRAVFLLADVHSIVTKTDKTVPPAASK